MSQSILDLRVVEIDVEAAPRFYRIQQITDGARREVTARLVEPAIYLPAPPRTGRRPVPGTPVIAGPAYARAFDLPRIAATPGLAHLAVTATPWPGGFAILRQLADGSHVEQAVANQPATMGNTLSPLPAGVVWRWDRRHTLDVQLSGGGLATLGEEAALSGGNALAVRGPDGLTEIVIARRADLIGPGTWRLGDLLRGLAGTEDAAMRPLAPGADIAVIDAGLVALTERLEDRAQTMTLRIVPEGAAASDPFAMALAVDVGGRSLRPLAPVHARARRSPAGVTLTWVRRTRIDGDPWEGLEVPLGEDSELYRVTLFDASGANVLRSFTVPQASLLYPSAQELADFGTPQGTLRLDIRQISQAVGDGLPLAATVAVA